MLYLTGATGHSGYWLLERLKREQCADRIRCLVRPHSDTSHLDSSNLAIEKVAGDLNDQDLVTKSMEGARAVLHIASIKHSRTVVDAAMRNGVEWVILVHTTGRYSKYKSASAEYIQIEDDILRMRDRIGITVLRPTMIYGSSRDRNMYRLVDYLYRHKFFPIFGSGKNLMQPVHARDLGNAYYDTICNGSSTLNKEYNLPGEHALPYIDIVRTVSQALGRNTVIVKIPLRASVAAAKVYNALDRNAIISVEQVLRMQEDKAFDYSDAARDFGYSPVPFEAGILDEVSEYLASARRCGTRR